MRVTQLTHSLIFNSTGQGHVWTAVKQYVLLVEARFYGNVCGQSSFSRLAIVSAPCMVKVPHETLLHIFAPLGCGFLAGAGAIFNTLNARSGETMTISGNRFSWLEYCHGC